MTQPFPLPRETRESAPFDGDGATTVFGPFGFKIFDTVDVTVLAKPEDGIWAPIAATVAKTTADAFAFFTVTIAPAPAATTSLVVIGDRVQQRSSDVTRGGFIDTDELEKELSKLGLMAQELRRDGNRSLRLPPGSAAEAGIIEPGSDERVPFWQDGRLRGNGPTVTKIEEAQSWGEAAEAARDETITARNITTAARDVTTAARDVTTAARDVTIAARDVVIGLAAQVDEDADQVTADRAVVQDDKVTTTFAADLAVAAQAATEAARDATLAAFADFNSRYLGALEAAPTLDNEGNPLDAGDLYFDSTLGKMYVYTGSIWTAAYVSGDGVALLVNNGSDYNAATFRLNLDLYSTAQIDGFTVKLTGNQTIAGIKTFSSAPVVPDGSFATSKIIDFNSVVDGRADSRADARIAAAVGVTVQAHDPQLSSLIRQNSQSAAYTLQLTDGGKHLLHPAADTTARTFTIPANASVAFPIGTAITFINQNGAGVITIAITSDTMRLAGAGTTGSRTLAANGIATAIKIAATEWIISGVGLT